MSFDEASAFVTSLSGSNTTLDNATLLDLYGLYKTATVGAEPVGPRPSFFDMRGRAKWDSWKACAARSSEEARERYIEVAKRLGWKEGTSAPIEAPEAGPSQRPPAWTNVSTISLSDEADASSSALHAAVAEGDRVAVLALLEDAPERINEQDSSGNTPLHIAADRGRSDIAQILLDRGANRDVRDADGQTPLDAARLAEQTELVTLLSR